MNDLLPNLAVHGSHNATVVVEYDKKILEVIEFERFFNVKNLGFCQYYTSNSRRYFAEIILQYLRDKYGFTTYNKVFHQHCYGIDNTFTPEVTKFDYFKLFPAREYIEMKHHEAHASGTFYQSPFEKALIISFDGGGNDGFFNIYKADRLSGIETIDKINIDLGFAYMIFGEYLDAIRKETFLWMGNLVYSGKILGYQSYGKVVPEWYQPFMDFYRSKPNGETYSKLIEDLGFRINVCFDANNRLKGELAENIAATSQRVFEDLFFEIANKYIVENDLPICLTGGCALNIVLNTRVKNTYNRPVFVGSNPSDCGIATGMMLQYLKPQYQYDVSYLGIPVLDKNMLPREIEKRGGQQVSLGRIVNDLYNDKIIGVVQGNSEHGPRALGNRSIICSPLNKDMKDILNAKVKNREYYRPFAPIVRLEDVSEYFNWEGASEFMSFCPTVKEQYRNILPSITHVDGTARVQTVTREKNPFIYDLLTLFKQQTGVGVLINTSFNINGKPILSSYSDAFWLFDNTKLDCLYLEGYYFSKNT